MNNAKRGTMDIEALRSEVEQRLRQRVDGSIVVEVKEDLLARKNGIERAHALRAQLRYGAQSSLLPIDLSLDEMDRVFMVEHKARLLEETLRHQFRQTKWGKTIICTCCGKTMGQCDDDMGAYHFCNTACASSYFEAGR